MTITRKALGRRTFLRGLGTAIGLPFLDAMVPALSFGKASSPPVRMAFVYVPIGAIMDHWNPSYTGTLGELPRILKPMEPFKKDMLLLREALLDLTGVLNRPQPDAALIALAGVDLDRALFPLLVRVERRGPLGIGELAELVVGSDTRLAGLLHDRAPTGQL